MVIRPVRPELAIKRIDKFEILINSFTEKVSNCKLNNIDKDIISVENSTRELDIDVRNPRLEPRQYVRYSNLLNKYKNAIKFLENNCKCKPI